MRSREDVTTIKRVDNEAGCGDAEAWHYDDMGNPSRIIACPRTCDTIRASDFGTIDIVFGCEVVILE